MNAKELEALVDSMRELGASSKETATAIRGFSNELKSVKGLWRQGGTSKLIKIGLAIIAFPDPTVSDVIGCALVAAGIVQTKIKNSALHVEDVYKTFPKIMKELKASKLAVG